MFLPLQDVILGCSIMTHNHTTNCHLLSLWEICHGVIREPDKVICDEPMTDRLGPMGRDNTYGELEGAGHPAEQRCREKMAAQCGSLWEVVEANCKAVSQDELEDGVGVHGERWFARQVQVFCSLHALSPPRVSSREYSATCLTAIQIFCPNPNGAPRSQCLNCSY